MGVKSCATLTSGSAVVATRPSNVVVGIKLLLLASSLGAAGNPLCCDEIRLMGGLCAVLWYIGECVSYSGRAAEVDVRRAVTRMPRMTERISGAPRFVLISVCMIEFGSTCVHSRLGLLWWCLGSEGSFMYLVNMVAKKESFFWRVDKRQKSGRR